MESNWAAEHLQVIRTLMERSALYRRALAPIMIFNGLLGSAAALLGWLLRIEAPRSFILYWASVALFALAGSFLLVRRQALKESEAFWSPPTRRITQAVLPGLVVGFCIGGLVFISAGAEASNRNDMLGIFWLPLTWVILYGCAVHAAGF